MAIIELPLSGKTCGLRSVKTASSQHNDYNPNNVNATEKLLKNPGEMDGFANPFIGHACGLKMPQSWMVFTAMGSSKAHHR